MPWPTVPANLMEPASDLKPLSDDKKTLTDLIENANDNYTSYYTLKLKYNSWIEWYNMQKSIYENIK